MPIALALIGASRAADLPPVLSLEDAIARVEQVPSVLALQDAQTAAWAQYAQAWPARLPTVSVSGNVLVYDEDQKVKFIKSDEPLDCTRIPEPFDQMCDGFKKPIVVHDQVTTSATARVSLPITGQLAIDRQTAAAHASAEAADEALAGGVADARYAVIDAWYGAVEAEEQLGIAQAQLRSLTERVETAKASFAAGSLVKSDLLLAEIAASQAEQVVLELTGFRDAAYTRLGVAIGNGGQPVRPSEITEQLPPAPPDVDHLVDEALGHRPDVLAMEDRVRAARASAAATSLARIPSINGTGAYTHVTGQGLFADDDTFYVGASVDWNVWAWGKAAAAAKAGKANADQAEHQLESLEALVRLDVRTRAQSLTTALAAVEVASTTLEQAEENRRIQEQRLGVGGGTMQELLDADVALEKARSTSSAARIGAYRAAAGLVRAVGEDPWGR